MIKNKKYIFNINKKRLTKRAGALIMTGLMLFCAGCGEAQKKSTIVPGSSILPVQKKEITELETKGNNEITLTGILSYVNTSEMKMHFMDIDTGTEYEVPYTGGTDIQDKYQKIIVAASMNMGSVYEVSCSKSGKAVSIHESQKSWSKSGITGAEFDEETRKIIVGNTTYIYEKHAAVLSNSNKINIAQIVDQDKITLKGIGDKVYSISVDEGHGYISFTGIEAFVGGYVSIGNNQLFEVTSGMVTTTREGTYKIELQKGSQVAEKTVTVTRDKTVTVDFSEYSTTAVQTGAINFSVTPKNAIMTIDGKEVDYSEAVSLTYGTHRITLSANNYEKYTETITVNKPYETKVIDMVSTSAATTTKDSSTKKSNNTATTAKDLTDGYSVSITAPTGAALYVDSVYIGIIPCSFHKSSGNKTITLSQNGFETVSYNIAIANATGNLTYAFPAMSSSQNPSNETSTTTAAGE